ncbi:EamA family transporter [Flavobacterium magnum]|uniref:EamA family transporter n=1 Tax=Flavobacterium magnum TaxID=2162713 RepID=A0A2S0RGD2_9FLAO|nr:EamA family transporter [Flavobacterium magnum]AWA30724.1 EamA family transporter [Flavobacterium magnum]
MRFNKYYAAALTAFIMWGFFSLVLKPLHDYPSMDILFYRIFFAVALLLGINLIFRRSVLKNDLQVLKAMSGPEQKALLLMTAAGGILLTANWFIFIYAMNHVSMKSASFAYLICPILTTILAFFILREKLNKLQWSAIALSVVSCVLLSYGSLRDLMFSLVIALTFALYLIIQRRYSRFDRLVVLSVQIMITAVLLLPLFPTYGGAVPTAWTFYVLIGVIAVFFTIIPLFLNLFALKGMDSSAVGILMYINPMINFLLAVFWYHEKVTHLEAVAYGLILLSVVVFNSKILFRKKMPLTRRDA